jgi:hypothetical protein
MTTLFSSPAYATMLSSRSVPLGQKAKAFVVHLPVTFYLNTCFGFLAQALLLTLPSFRNNVSLSVLCCGEGRVV